MDEILDAATRLLAEDGYAELSTRKVAARAGMRPGNLQYYFPAKRDLVHALLERYLQRSLERLAARAEKGEQTPEGLLRQVIENILAEQASVHDCTLFREIWALAAHDAAVAMAVAEFHREYCAHLGALLRNLNPKLTKGASKRLATAVVAMLEGLSLIREHAEPAAAPNASHICAAIVCLAGATSAWDIPRKQRGV